VSGVYICFLCELAGCRGGQRFTVPADDAGQARMRAHVLEPHCAEQAQLSVSFADELVDVALGGGR
jgi:hypothetical protein